MDRFGVAGTARASFGFYNGSTRSMRWPRPAAGAGDLRLMSDLRDLYQEVILDHGRKPRNFRRLPAATCEAKGDNPLCGDRVTVYLKVKDGIVEDVDLRGPRLRHLDGLRLADDRSAQGQDGSRGARALRPLPRLAMTGKSACHGADADDLEKLTALSGVHEFPMRVKCATLAWHTLKAALDHKQTAISTEGA